MSLELAATAGDTSEWFKAIFGAYGPTVVQLFEIIGINILLSGDNAVVIALACRSLPKETRWLGIALGVLAAIALRIIFTLGLQAVLSFPYLMLVGGAMLFYIALQLLAGGAPDDADVEASTSVWGAVRTVALADAVMSLDNVLAIAGAAQGRPELIIFGLATSIPLIVGGAAIFMALFTKYPLLVWGGAGLLGWIAGELIAKEKALADFFHGVYVAIGFDHHTFDLMLAATGAALVIIAGLVLKAMAGNSETEKPSAEAKS